MFADTLLAAERGHLLRLALWGAMSVVMGSAIWAVLAARRVRSPLLMHFAIQTGAWGAVDLAICAAAWRGLKLRDLSGAVSLDRFLWFNIGLDVGYVAVGVTLALVGWRLARSLGLVGAGIGVVVQGAALAVLDLILASVITRG
jgi:membrane protease YdiL (CAAX protease family)